MDKGDDDKAFMRKKGKKQIIHYNLNLWKNLILQKIF